MDRQHSAFLNALKDEVEQASEGQRRQNIDLMNLIKGISSTLKKLKEAQMTFTHDDHGLKDTVALIASHQTHVINFLNLRSNAAGLSPDELVNPGILLEGQGSTGMHGTSSSVNPRMNHTQGHLLTSQGQVQSEKQSQFLKKANETMKKV